MSPTPHISFFPTYSDHRGHVIKKKMPRGTLSNKTGSPRRSVSCLSWKRAPRNTGWSLLPRPPPASPCEASRWGQLSDPRAGPPQSLPFPKGGQKTSEAWSLPDRWERGRSPGSSGAPQTLPPGRPSTVSVTSSRLKSPSHSSINLLCSYGNTFILEERFPSASPALPAHRL